MAKEMPELINNCFLKHDVDKGIYMIKFYGGLYKGEKVCRRSCVVFVLGRPFAQSVCFHDDSYQSK